MAKKIRWTDADTRATLGVARCGYFAKENFRDVGLSDRRINTLSTGDSKIFEKVGRDVNTGEEVYKLSEVGKERAEELGVARDVQYFNPNVGQNFDFRHDRELARQYCSLDRDCQDRWKTEKEYIREIREVREHIRVNDPDRWQEIKDIKHSSFDGGYIDDRGQEHYVEVITDSYTKDRIDSKCESANMLGGSMHMTKV